VSDPTIGGGAVLGATRAPRTRKRRVLAGLAAVAILIAVLVGVLGAFRYLPALDDARALRADLEAMVDRVQTAGLDIDAATIGRLEADLAAARTRLVRLQVLVADDPLVGIARILPPSADSVRGADAMVAAGSHLLDGVAEGLAVGRRYVETRDAGAIEGGGSVLASLVDLMATTRTHAEAAAAAVGEARRSLAAVPAGSIGQVLALRDAMSVRVERYSPLLDTYVEASGRLPAILGWEGPRRYLVLTQDPAELRPTGGFLGTHGIVGFDRGRMTERVLRETGPLDYPWDYPRIEPPRELADYLLGPRQPWQFADANWSPHFPTSARDALRLYTNQTGDGEFDGVIAITTFTIDELLRVTGPIAVPGYDVSVAAGETTMKVLERTRLPSAPGVEAKAFMFAFADRLIDALLALPPSSWGQVIDTFEAMDRERLLFAWFVDPADQELVEGGPFSGAVRDDPGDFVYPVDSNVAPVSKLNIVTTRSLDLDVRLDAVGNARNTLSITWDNQVDSPAGEHLMALDNVGGRILGMYSRILVPERSRVESVTGGGSTPLSDPASVGEEAGRTVIGTYLQIPAGQARITCTWTSPYASDTGDAGGFYRLTLQKQPGLLPGPVRVTITVPEGAMITAASPALVVSGSTATLTTTLDRDLVVGLRYEP